MSSRHKQRPQLNCLLALLLPLIFYGRTPLFAQDTTPPESRTWIRLTTLGSDSAGKWIVGRVDFLMPDHVLLQPIGAVPLWVPRRSIVRIERHDGWRDRRLLGTIWGAVGGLAIGMILDRAVGCGALCYLSAPIGAGLGFHVGRRTVNLQWTPVTFAELDIERIRSSWLAGGTLVGRVVNPQCRLINPCSRTALTFSKGSH